MKKKLAYAGVPAVIAGVIFSASAFAADSANKDSKISLKVKPNIELENVDDIAFEPNSDQFGADLSKKDTICVAGTGFNTYKITFSSERGKGTDSFLMKPKGDETAEGETIPYYVSFANNTDEAAALEAMITDQERDGFEKQSVSCADGELNAQFQVDLKAGDWDREEVLDGSTSYEDNLNITVTAT